MPGAYEMDSRELSAAAQTMEGCALYYLATESLFAAASLASREFGSGFEGNPGGASLLKGFRVVNCYRAAKAAILIVLSRGAWDPKLSL